MEFIPKDEFPYTNGKLVIESENIGLDSVSAISVNTTHGTERSVQLFATKFNADLETMEGAAAFYVCKMQNVKVMQIRAVSNYVEVRNKANWNILLAIERLNEELLRILGFKQ